MKQYYLHQDIEVFNHRGAPYLKGYADFDEEDIFGLKTGDKIIKIGSGNPTGSNSVFRTTNPIIYRGRLFVDGYEYMAFEIDAVDIKGWNLFNQQKTVYFLLNFDNDYLYCVNIDNNKAYRYNPVFEKVK